LNVHRVEDPAADACPERVLLAPLQFGKPRNRMVIGRRDRFLNRLTRSFSPRG
jgi:hypothetical protein